MIENFDSLVNEAKKAGPLRIALAAAEDESALEAVKAAQDAGLVIPALVGNKDEIIPKAKKIGLKFQESDIIDAKDKTSAAFSAVRLVSGGKADLLMKGIIHTDTLLKAVLDKETGLRTGNLLSHSFLMKVPAYHKLLFLTDCAMCIAPALEEKKYILQNCIDFARSLGLVQPKAAILAAVEEVNEKMPATTDAACLSKMADRGQIKGALVDGPLAFDNAISKRAAEEKGIKSPVAGDADILMVPNIEVGNVLFKALAYMAGALNAGIILGAKSPIVLTSRADTAESKFYSIALGVYLTRSKLQAAEKS